MKRKNKVKIPKGFFQIERPTVSAKEALEDVIPVEWVDNKNSKKIKIEKKAVNQN